MYAMSESGAAIVVLNLIVVPMVSCYQFYTKLLYFFRDYIYHSILLTSLIFNILAYLTKNLAILLSISCTVLCSKVIMENTFALRPI